MHRKRSKKMSRCFEYRTRGYQRVVFGELRQSLLRTSTKCRNQVIKKSNFEEHLGLLRQNSVFWEAQTQPRTNFFNKVRRSSFPKICPSLSRSSIKGRLKRRGCFYTNWNAQNLLAVNLSPRRGCHSHRCH